MGSTLPATLTSFVGRERAVPDLVRLLLQAETRLVTLVGPGGVGKTRLSIEVARKLASEMGDGVAFVDFTTVPSADVLEPSVARSLGIREQADRSLAERVADILGDPQLLLVLDNFDPFVSASTLVLRMLALCPRMKVLVTSREPLHLSAERVVMVTPLSLPAANQPTSESVVESEAVRLFIDRAMATRADFSVTEANYRTIAEIVRRVDGLPLAIELAAARLTHLPPATLLKRLERRLPLLTGGARDLPERQRTLRDAIAWSYDLLTPIEQRVFRSQAAFVGGCTLEAAEFISDSNAKSAGVTLDNLASLVSKSLLRLEEDGDGAPRYTMLETVREFGLEQMAAAGEEEAVRDQHAAYFLDLVERGDPSIWGGPDHTWWLDRLEAEFANLEAALCWLETSGDGPAFLRLAAALGGLWHYRSHRAEGRAWLKRALEIGGDTVPAARAMAFIKLGMLERVSGGVTAAELTMEGITIRRELGNQRGIGRALMNLGNVLKDLAEYDRAVPVLEEAARLLERVGDVGGLATSRMYLGMVLLEQGDSARAHSLLTDALNLHRKDGFDYGAASTLLTLAHIAASRGDETGAAAHYAESLHLWIKVKNHEGLAEALAATGSLALAVGQPDSAARLLAAATALAEALGYVAPARNRKRLLDATAAARAALGAQRFDMEWAVGRDVTHSDAAIAAAEFLDRVGISHVGSKYIPSVAGILTPREQSVLRLIVEGLSDREIAQQLGISYRSVTSYVRNILTKFNVHSRTAAATYATRRGLI